MKNNMILMNNHVGNLSIKKKKEMEISKYNKMEILYNSVITTEIQSSC